MKKERLSRLQRWVLKTCYNRSSENYSVSRRELSLGYFGRETASTEASISRSLWLLLERGYVNGLSPMKVENMAMIYGMQRKSLEEFKKDYGHFKPSDKIASFSIRKLNKIKIITITNKGKEKVKQMLNVK